MQVHINLLTGSVWLVLTFKTCTAQDTATNFIGSVFRELGLPDCIVSDHDMRLVADFWTSLYEALCKLLIFGTHHHHHTTAKIEHVSGVVGVTLCALVNYQQDNWPTYIPLVKFATNDSASTFGCGYTPFFADLGEHQRRPLTAPAAVGGAALALSQALARVTSQARYSRCCRSARTSTSVCWTAAVGQWSSQWATRCCWTPPLRPSRPEACGWGS